MQQCGQNEVTVELIQDNSALCEALCVVACGELGLLVAISAHVPTAEFVVLQQLLSSIQKFIGAANEAAVH